MQEPTVFVPLFIFTPPQIKAIKRIADERGLALEVVAQQAIDRFILRGSTN